VAETIPYSPQTLRGWSDASVESARVILPLVFALDRPRAVIDVGCAIGNWAATCRELGVEEVVGVDGDYVDRDALLIPHDRFLAHDLTRPLSLDRRFDLAISVEVAEHLPEGRAAGFVSDLCGLAPMVLFSAAIPFQGGLDHLNEQWPAYWVDRFAKHGYTPVDCVRDEVWDNPKVASWYAQNTLLYVAPEAQNPAITGHRGFGRAPARVHPAVFTTYAGGRYQRMRRRFAQLLARLRPKRQDHSSSTLKLKRSLGRGSARL
jgi:SAM-dependent methyltransferase